MSQTFSQTNIDKMVREPGYWEVEGTDDNHNRRLGIHYGLFEEIALHYADKQGYYLCMKKIPAEQMHAKLMPTKSKVEVSLEYPGSYSMTENRAEKISAVSRVFNGRDARKTKLPMKVSTDGGRIIIELTGQEAIREAVKHTAMEKLRGVLNAKEMEALGLLNK